MPSASSGSAMALPCRHSEDVAIAAPRQLDQFGWQLARRRYRPCCIAAVAACLQAMYRQPRAPGNALDALPGQVVDSRMDHFGEAAEIPSASSFAIAPERSNGSHRPSSKQCRAENCAPCRGPGRPPRAPRLARLHAKPLPASGTVFVAPTRTGLQSRGAQHGACSPPETLWAGTLAATARFRL